MSGSGQRRARLATRVMLSAIGSGAMAGALAAVVAVIAVDRMVEDHGDRRLSGAAAILAGEIDEGFDEGEWEPLGEIVADENAEMVATGVRLAVFSSGHRIAGDAWVPEAPPGRCETHGAVGGRARACGRSYRNWVLVAAAHSDEAALRYIYVSAGAAALLAGALLGALVSIRLTRWALSPLTELGSAIGRLKPDAPDAAQLGPSSQCDEVEQIRDALAGLLRRSQSLLQQTQRFAADAAHELRTPLTAIRAELELLLEQAHGDDRAALARASERTRQLGELVERLLVLAAPIEQRQSRFETVALADCVAEAAAALPPEQQQRVTFALPIEGLLRGDPALLRSMVANAIDNALKFSGTQPIEVELAQDGDDIALTVRDRGPGVPPAQRERVFAPFYRAAPDATAGHGLGLSLIGHIARAHGGSAEFVDSESGAVLRVRLPGWKRAGEAPEPPLTRRTP